MTASQVERVADAFWERCGARPDPPRDVEPLAPLACDVFFRSVRSLTPHLVREWLRGQGLTVPAAADRPLFGCVVAYRGRAAVFLDESLPPDERRVIAAHELGHLLAEYLVPRERAVRRLGPSVLPILDGDRNVTFPETWASLLAGVRFGVHAHSLERTFDPNGILGRAERTANSLALELLAPRASVPADCGPFETLLTTRYGLPPRWAAGYAGRLAAEAARNVPFTRRWGL